MSPPRQPTESLEALTQTKSKSYTDFYVETDLGCDWCDFVHKEPDVMKSHMKGRNHPSCSQYTLTTKNEQSTSDDVVEMERSLSKPTVFREDVDDKNDLVAACPLCSMTFSNKFIAAWHHRVVHDQTYGRYAICKITLRGDFEVSSENVCRCGEKFARGGLLHKHWMQNQACFPFPEAPKKSIILCECVSCGTRGFSVTHDLNVPQCGILLSMRNHCIGHQNKGPVRMKIMFASEAEKKVSSIEPHNTSSLDTLSFLFDIGNQCLKESSSYKFFGKAHLSQIKAELKLLTSLMKKS